MNSEANPQVIAEINKIFVDLFEVAPEKLHPEVKLYEDLGLDSIDAIDMIVSFEKKFQIRPPNEELQKIRKLSDVYSLVNRYANERLDQA